MKQLRQLRSTRPSAVLVGDTPYDVRAGRRAGVRVIGVRSGGWAARELEGAREIYRDVCELARRFEDSVLGPRWRRSAAA